MSSSPPDPPDPPDQSPGSTEAERFGPLLLRRLVKADGRSLILFSRADGPPPDEDRQR